MNKKLCIFLLYAGFFSLENVQAQWSFEKCPTRNNLNDISFINKDQVWIAGDKGTLLYKKDSEWREYHPKPTFEDLYSIEIIDEHNGWAVGANGTIIIFDGENWKPIVSPTKKNLLSVCFKDRENGIAVGESGTVIIYKNGIWCIFKNEIRGDFFTAYFENDNIWIGGGLECTIVPIMTIPYNSGTTLIKSFESFASINSIFFLNSWNGWAVGSPSTILHFDGEKWQKPVINDKFSSLKSIFILDENNGISVGYNGTILIFSDNKWIKEDSNITHNLKGSAIIENTYYAVGDSGTILRKNKISGNSRMSALEIINERIDLFPNPCDNILNLKLAFENYQPVVRIIITAPNGQVVVQKNLYAWNSNPTCQISTSELKNGLYNLQVIIGAKSRTAKFIIMH